MKVHHLNCGTMRPPGASLLGLPARLGCHCLAIESETGVVLVDTGFGVADVASPVARLGLGFLAMAGPSLHPQETAVAHLRRLGLRPADVRHIVLTHLDVDHAGGLADFPHAEVHVFGTEYAAAAQRGSVKERSRYRPIQWAHGPRWAIHNLRGERWCGFEAVSAIAGLPPEILLVPIPGHTRGHCGVAVRVDAGWLLHCGDVCLRTTDLGPAGPPPGRRAYQRLNDIVPAAFRANAERLDRLAGDPSAAVRLITAHDLDAFLDVAQGVSP